MARPSTACRWRSSPTSPGAWQMALIASGRSGGFISRRTTARHDRWVSPRWKTGSFRRRSGFYSKRSMNLCSSMNHMGSAQGDPVIPHSSSSSWTGCKWLVEVDVRGFFDNIDHDILLGLLRKRIDDDRFIGLIEGMLKAGYMEDWVYGRTLQWHAAGRRCLALARQHLSARAGPARADDEGGLRQRP